MNDSCFKLPATATFWAIMAALLLIALTLFSGILLPFAASFVLAYLFNPVVDGLHRAGVPRAASALIMVALSIMALAAVIALIVPPLAAQIGEVIENLPVWYERAQSYIGQHYGQYLEHIAGPQKPGEPAAAEQLRQHIAPWLVSQAQGLLKSGASLFNSIALLFLTPVITFFLLRDWDKMLASVREFLPRQQAPAIIEVVREIDTTISAYLRGTLIVLLIVSAFYMVSLGLIGLHYGLLIGLVAGMFSFVPYLGSAGGFLASGGVALAQFWPDYTMVGAVCGVFVFGQVIEGNVLTPNIVGNKVGLHPVWLLFALVASGYVLGFLGLIISVPLAATIGVLVRYAVRRYYESALHNEGSDGQRAGNATAARG
jgi:predicted PurR-regulated permease PerM